MMSNNNNIRLLKCLMVSMIIVIFISFMVTSRVLAQWPYSGSYSEPPIENQLYAAYRVSPEGAFIWPWGGRQYPISPYPTTSWIGQSYNYGGYWPPYGGQAHYGYHWYDPFNWAQPFDKGLPGIPSYDSYFGAPYDGFYGYGLPYGPYGGYPGAPYGSFYGTHRYDTINWAQPFDFDMVGTDGNPWNNPLNDSWNILYYSYQPQHQTDDVALYIDDNGALITLREGETP